MHRAETLRRTILNRVAEMSGRVIARMLGSRYGILGGGAVTTAAWAVDFKLGLLTAGMFLLILDNRSTG